MMEGHRFVDGADIVRLDSGEEKKPLINKDGIDVSLPFPPAVKPSPFRKRLPLQLTKDLSYLNDTAGGALVEQKDGTPESTELERAKHSDLITLPDEIDGTNCGNCKYVTPEKYCIHPEVDQPVTPRQCCKYWDALGTHRAWLPEGGELEEQSGEKAMKRRGDKLKPRPTGSDRLVRIKMSKGDLAGQYAQSVNQTAGIVIPATSKAAALVTTLESGYDMIQAHKRHGDHYGLWLEEISEQEYNERGYKSLDGKKNVDGFLTKAAGTCQPGQRSDLTGCTPASGEVDTPKESSEDDWKVIETWSSKLLGLPGAIVRKAKRNVLDHYTKLESRYGRKYALAIIAAGIVGTPLPVPGATLAAVAPVIVLAELHRRLIGGSAGQKDMRLTPEEIEKLGREFVATLLLDGAVGQKGIKGSYFAECERDEGGQCLPSGQVGEPGIEEGKNPKKPKTQKEPKKKPKKTTPKKAGASRGEMAEARREGKGKEAKIVMGDGTPAPEHIKASMVPPDWSDVRVSLDPKSDVLVTARDKAGRIKTVYSDQHHMRQAALKFARIREYQIKRREMFGQNQRNRQGKNKEEADCSWLMMVQGTRPGSDKDVKARVKAYGATTLRAEHVVIGEDGSVRLQFTGKEGVYHNHLIRDRQLAEMLKERAYTADERGGKIFDTNADRVQSYSHTLDGGRFTPKDFRTGRANSLAIRLIGDMDTPTDEKAYKKAVKQVAERVSSVLGNRPAQALESYIDPTVFSGWRNHAGF